MSDMISVSSFTPAAAMSEGGASLKSVLDSIAERARAEASTLDVTTEKGRKAIASLAYKVSRSKTALDDAGKALVSDIKKKASAIDADRKTARDALDALRDEVRKPLTDYEEREERRKARHEAALVEIVADASVLREGDAAGIENEADRIRGLFSGRDWEEYASRAEDIKEGSLASLSKAAENAIRRAAEQAELARLKAEEAERAAREEAERRKKEIEAAEQRAAELARIAAERAAQEREERAQKERAAELARVEAERVAAEKRAEAAEMAALMAAQKERERVEEAAAKAEAERVTREQDIEHRWAVNRAASADLVTHCGLTEEQAKAVVTAVAAGRVRGMKLIY